MRLTLVESTCRVVSSVSAHYESSRELRKIPHRRERPNYRAQRSNNRSRARFLRDVHETLMLISFLFQEQCQRRRPAHRGRAEEGAAREHRPDSETVPRR